MSVFISGSVAYDTILAFDGVFAQHLLSDSLEKINLTFQTPRMAKNYGGCAANIAYSLKAAGGDPLIVTTVGKDCADYLDHLQRLGIRTDAIKVIDNAFTPQAFITTDRLGNQMTAFHEGAMAQADKALPSPEENIDWGIVTPTGVHVMKTHVNYLRSIGASIIWDMGQASAYLSGEEINWFIDHVDILSLSSYEWDVLAQKTSLPIENVTSRLQALIVTEGGNGARLYLPDHAPKHFDALPISGPIYPVGCGDAFRGGLLRGLSLGLNWDDTMRLASLMGAIKAKSPTAQGYEATPEKIARSFERAFGKPIVL